MKNFIRFIFVIAIAAAATLFSSAATSAEMDNWDPEVHGIGDYTPELYSDNALCFVPVDGYPESVRGIWTADFELVNDYGPGVGSTSLGFLPCRPLSCPEPTYLVSASCLSSDPLAHIPTRDHHKEEVAVSENPPTSEAPQSAVEQTELTIDVGPLVEPAIYVYGA